MTTRMRSLRNFRNPIGCLILLAALGAAAGCSTAENPNGSATNMNHVLPSGSSVPGWLVVPTGGSHASTATQDYIATGGGSGCTECHGSDLSGGISGTSCFGNPAGLPPPAGRRLGHPCPRRPEPRRLREKSPGKLRLRLLPDLPREQLLRRRGEDAVLLLPRCERAAPRATVARLYVHPHEHGYGERAGLRAVPLPGLPEQPGEPSGHPCPGGNRARMLQQHAVPRRGRSSPPRGQHVGDDVSSAPAARQRREGGPRYDHRLRLLQGLPRYGDELLGRLVGGVLHQHRRLSWGDGLLATCVAVANGGYVRPHDHGPGERRRVRLLPPERRDLPDPGTEPAGPGGNRARMLQQHAVPRRGRSSPPRGQHVGDDVSSAPAARQRREGGPRYDHRLRLLQGLPRYGDELLGRLVGGVLHQHRRLSWGDGLLATCVAVANGGYVRPHDHGPGERRRVRLLPPERRDLPDPGTEPAGPGGNRARMLQQHAVPRPGCSPCRLVPILPARAGSQGRTCRLRRVLLLPGLPRDRYEFLGRYVGAVLLPVPPADCDPAARVAVAHRGPPRPHDHGPGERPGLRLLPPERRDLSDPGTEPAGPGGDRARMLQQHAVPRGGGRRAPGAVQRNDALFGDVRNIYGQLRGLPRRLRAVFEVRARLPDLPRRGLAAHGR